MIFLSFSILFKTRKNFSCWGADLHVISMKKEKLQPRWLWWLNYVQNMAIFNLLIYPMNLAEILRINSKWCNKTVKKIWYVKSTFDSSSWKVQTVCIIPCYFMVSSWSIRYQLLSDFLWFDILKPKDTWRLTLDMLPIFFCFHV